MKFMNIGRKYGKHVAVVSAGALVSASAYADGIGDIGQTFAAEINKVIPVITSAGMALLSVYILMKCFGLVYSFAKRG